MLQYIFNHPFHSKSETFGLVFRLCLYSKENGMVPWRNEISLSVEKYFNHLLCSLMKYFSALKDVKSLISVLPCHILRSTV